MEALFIAAARGRRMALGAWDPWACYISPVGRYWRPSGQLGCRRRFRAGTDRRSDDNYLLTCSATNKAISAATADFWQLVSRTGVRQL